MKTLNSKFLILNSQAAPVFASWWWDGDAHGEWTVDGGWHWIDLPTATALGNCGWMPTLRGSPDVTPQGPASDAMTFSALLCDYCHADSVAYHWSGDDDKVEISSPNSRETNVLFTRSVFGDEISLHVEASVGRYSLCSSLSFRVRLHPEVSISVLPSHIWVNQPVSDANKRNVTIRFSADIPTNGTLIVSYIGDASH